MNMMSCTSFLNRDTQCSCVLWCSVMNQGVDVGGYDEGAWRLLGNGAWSGEEGQRISLLTRWEKGVRY